jgi:CopG antitoxin of type II toxin-antitoxin system
MAENEAAPLPHFQSLPELVEYFDTHDMGEHWDHMPEAQFEVDIKRRHCLVSIDEDLMRKLSEIAKSRQVSVEVLIDAWLKEKVEGASR